MKPTEGQRGLFGGAVERSRRTIKLEFRLEDKPRFDGEVYEPKVDDQRLTGQILRVFGCMKDGQWRTLRELAEATGDPEASVSAQIRHLRKDRFGKYDIRKQPRGDRRSGLFEYKLFL